MEAFIKLFKFMDMLMSWSMAPDSSVWEVLNLLGLYYQEKDIVLESQPVYLRMARFLVMLEVRGKIERNAATAFFFVKMPSKAMIPHSLEKHLPHKIHPDRAWRLFFASRLPKGLLLRSIIVVELADNSGRLMSLPFLRFDDKTETLQPRDTMREPVLSLPVANTCRSPLSNLMAFAFQVNDSSGVFPLFRIKHVERFLPRFEIVPREHDLPCLFWEDTDFMPVLSYIKGLHEHGTRVPTCFISPIRKETLPVLLSAQRRFLHLVLLCPAVTTAHVHFFGGKKWGLLPHGYASSTSKTWSIAAATYPRDGHRVLEVLVEILDLADPPPRIDLCLPDERKEPWRVRFASSGVARFDKWIIDDKKDSTTWQAIYLPEEPLSLALLTSKSGETRLVKNLKVK